jgi:CheY-like chemotaxis protein
MKTRKKPFPTQKNDEPAIGPIHAFIAEDARLMMALLTRILSKDKRIKIVGSATDGWEALCYASSLDPDLVLVDLHMPGLDGAEVARRLKQRPNHPTIFVVTSDDRPESRARCLTAGADAFLVKRSDLSSQIQTAIQNFFPSSGAV